MVSDEELELAEEYNEYTRDEEEVTIKYSKFIRSVHVWIINADKELLLQKRNPRTISNANRWDVAIEDDLKEDESVVNGAIRIAKKNLGIDIVAEDLEYITTIRRVKYRCSMELRYIYLMRCNLPIEKYKCKKNAMGGLQYIHYTDLEKKVKKGDRTILKHFKEYKALFQYIKNFLD